MVNSEQEAQQVQMPVLLLLVLPVSMSQMVASNPRGLAAQILTLLPFSSPVLMPMRWTLDSVSIQEVLISLAAEHEVDEHAGEDIAAGQHEIGCVDH